MRRADPEAWSGLVMLAVAVGVCAPVLFGGHEPALPRTWWILAFAVMLASVLHSVLSVRPRARVVTLVTMWVASSVLVLGAPRMGLLVILLVVVAALSVYFLPAAAAWVIVVLNTVVIAVAGTRAGAPASEVALGTGFYLLIQVATVLGSIALLREQATRRRLAAANVELQAASALLAQSARDAERLRISRDLHDSLGHQLTVLNLELEVARHRADDGAREPVDRASALARTLLAEVRTTVGELRTEPGDLRDVLTRIVSDLPGLEVHVEVSRQVRAGEQERTVVVYAVREIVTNTIRHADASEVWIEVRHEDGHLLLTASDDGDGDRAFVPGNGLRGLAERFASLGGEVAWDPAPGFRVTARVPSP